MISSLISAGASVLDLGAGAGRLAKPLVGRGYSVTAVDQSAEMLAEIDGAECIHSTIESLDLGERAFDCVLLASYLLNVPDRAERAALLRCCRRFVAPGGVVMIQARNARVLDDLSDFEREESGIRDVVESYQRAGCLVTMTWRTEAGGREWVHTFTQEFLDQDALTSELAREHLHLCRWLDARREWFLAEAL